MAQKALQKRKKPGRGVPRSSYHETGILVESLRDDFKVVAEAVTATRETLEEKINELDTRLNQ